MKPCKHGVTPPEYCDKCSVEFKRPKKCKHIWGSKLVWCCDKCGEEDIQKMKPSIDPKAFEVFCEDITDYIQHELGIDFAERAVIRRKLRKSLKVYLKAERER